MFGKLAGDDRTPVIEERAQPCAELLIGKCKLERQVINRTTPHEPLAVKLIRQTPKHFHNAVTGVWCGQDRLNPGFPEGRRNPQGNNGETERFLVCKMMVQRAAGDPGRSGNVLNTGAVVALDLEKLERSIQNPPAESFRVIFPPAEGGSLCAVVHLHGPCNSHIGDTRISLLTKPDDRFVLPDLNRLEGSNEMPMSLDLAAVGLAAFGVASPGAGLAEPSFPIVELRQYTLHDGRRDELIALFEREFIQSQEALGMKVMGTFTDLDHPNRFVWIRGFETMQSRQSGLSAFYYGPVWKLHREAANATMIDSDNVLLLGTPGGANGFRLPPRSERAEAAKGGIIVATIHYLKGINSEAAQIFEERICGDLKSIGAAPIAWYSTETAPNNFPQLPVREKDRVLIWFSAYANEAEHDERKAKVDHALAPLIPLLTRDSETLRLKPTARSLVR